MNAKIAEHVGTPQLKQFLTVYIDMWHHPKYYKELRKRNKSDQAISKEPATAGNQRSPGPGLKQQAASDSQVVNQVKLSSQSQASSVKPQAPEETSDKRQAPSSKPQA